MLPQAKKEAGTPGLRYVDSLMLRVLIRAASGKEGGRGNEIDVITRARHEEPQKLRLFMQ